MINFVFGSCNGLQVWDFMALNHKLYGSGFEGRGVEYNALEFTKLRPLNSGINALNPKP